MKVRQQKANYWQGGNAPLKVSDDGKMAVKHIDGVPNNSRDYQVFYATSDVLQHSATELAKVGSAFTIRQGASTIVGRPPGSKKSTPTQTLYKAEVENQDLARIGKGDYTFNACSANLQNFLGILRSKTADPTKLEQKREVILKLQGSLDHDKKLVNTGSDLSVAMQKAREIITGTDSSGESRRAYDNMKESFRKRVAQQYGVDEHALPDVGEGFGIIQGGKGGRQGMGHFAPVIAQSGGDRVTLENDVSQTAGRERPPIGDINPAWYFRMFGTDKKQSFWGQAQKFESEDFGSRPLVTTLGSAKRG